MKINLPKELMAITHHYKMYFYWHYLIAPAGVAEVIPSVFN